MSQVTEQSVRFQTALASIKLIQASAVLDLTEDDFDFLTSNKVWIAQCLASISRWITASSSWKRFCLFVCRALSSIMVICMLTAIRLLLTFVMSLYLLLRS